MIRDTSVTAYNQIKAEGLLSKRRWQAYDILFREGPMTGNELSWEGRCPGLWKRCSELQELGLASEVGERQCKITGRKAIVWDVTSRMPVRFDKPKKIKCGSCRGKGYITESQGRLI